MEGQQEQAMRIAALALKPASEAPMQKVLEAEAQVDGGFAGGVRPSPERGLTLLASGQWEQVQQELGLEMSWHLRRANVLVDAAHLRDLIGRRVQLGEAVLEVTDETKPCWLMETQQPGLLKALVPELRAGVFGRVVTGGMLRVGDRVTDLGPIAAAPSTA